MIIQNQPKTIEDFLKAVNFIAPQGTDLKYFIVPVSGNTPLLSSFAQDAGFEPNEQKSNVMNIPGVTDTIVYQKKDMKSIQSTSPSRINVLNASSELPITHGDEAVIEIKAQPAVPENAVIPEIISSVLTPQNQQALRVVESTDRFCDVILKETMDAFPKGTLFHFVRG